MAGWLFADLSLVLAIAFVATSSNDFVCRDKASGKPLQVCEPPETTEVSATTTTAAISDSKGNGGVKPDPIEVIVRNGARLSPSSLRARLDEAITEKFRSDPKLSALGDPSVARFGVIIVRGGDRGSTADRVGTDNAERAKSKLEWPETGGDRGWNKALRTTYFDTGHNSMYPLGDLQFKLFPILPATEE